MTSHVGTRAGRPRDVAIDATVLDVALAHLAASGLTGLSITAVAHQAGTSRPAVYRRWPTKLDLAVAAVAALAEVSPPVPTGDPFDDLVAELQHFRHCITQAGSLALAAVMLQDGVDPQLLSRYREHVVVPRRARLRSCLARAVERSLIDPDADLDVAGSLFTGSWYAYALGGDPVPADWAPRVARLVWCALGGSPPPRN